MNKENKAVCGYPYNSFPYIYIIISWDKKFYALPYLKNIHSALKGQTTEMDCLPKEQQQKKKTKKNCQP